MISQFIITGSRVFNFKSLVTLLPSMFLTYSWDYNYIIGAIQLAREYVAIVFLVS